MDNYRIRYVDLPCTVNGLTIEDSDGFYNIYINSKLSVDRQNEAIKHELAHIKRNDFNNEKSLQDAEAI